MSLKAPICMPMIDGPMATQSGLVFFAATQDYYLRSFNSFIHVSRHWLSFIKEMRLKYTFVVIGGIISSTLLTLVLLLVLYRWMNSSQHNLSLESTKPS